MRGAAAAPREEGLSCCGAAGPPGLGTAAALKSDAFLEMHKRVSDRKFVVVSIQSKGLSFNSKETGERVFVSKDKALLWIMFLGKSPLFFSQVRG